jgi:ubiquinone/menaquinone biosynthesis C-methylase UbiE
MRFQKNENKKQTSTRQTKSSVDKNFDYFLGSYESYKSKIESIDTYAMINSKINHELFGIKKMLDIGNGGVFDYEVSLVPNITGLDLFLDDLPKGIVIPKNVKMVQGSALEIPFEKPSFDGVIMVMLLHHLVGQTPKESLLNVEKALSEAGRVIKRGGKLIIVESCVPFWFYQLEKFLYRSATILIEKFMRHPATLQYPKDVLRNVIFGAGFRDILIEEIPKGRFILQFGVKVPSWITPVRTILFSAIKK